MNLAVFIRSNVAIDEFHPLWDSPLVHRLKYEDGYMRSKNSVIFLISVDTASKYSSIYDLIASTDKRPEWIEYCEVIEIGGSHDFAVCSGEKVYCGLTTAYPEAFNSAGIWAMSNHPGRPLPKNLFMLFLFRQ